MSNTNWLEVDRKGLAQLIEGKAKSWILYELIQNALDEQTTEVKVEIKPVSHGKHRITVTDDSPDGYQDIKHAWTLYAPSKKKADAEKRGRFNIGCKMVLALAENALIVSTQSAVSFGERGRELKRNRREFGTEFTGIFKMSKAEAKEAYDAVMNILLPGGVKISIEWWHSERCPTTATLSYMDPFKRVNVNLPTVFSDDEGNLRPSKRNTSVHIHQPDAGESAWLYEMGIPVVELDGEDPWHLNVQQRVPLNTDRDNVTPAFLRTLRVAVLNAAHGDLDKDEAKAVWVTEASEDERAETKAVETVLDHRFTKKRVAYDPSDEEANKIAMSKGYQVVYGGSLTAGQWANAKSSDSIRPAGKVTPSPSVSCSPDGIPPINPDKWDDTMREIMRFAHKMHGELEISDRLLVSWYSNVKLTFSAAWGTGGSLSFNKVNMGRILRAWRNNERRPLVALLIHEFAHQRVSDHLSSEYYDECCRIGAELFEINMEVFTG